MRKSRTPQDDNYNKAKLCEILEFIFYTASYIFSLICTLICFVPEKIFLVIGGLLLCSIFAIQILKKKNFDSASKLRIAYFLDNAYDTKREPHKNKNFYNNSGVSAGLKRVYANLHESSFFTGRITQKMLPAYWWGSALIIIVFVGLLFWNGIEEVSTLILNMILGGGFVKKTVFLKLCNKEVEDIYKKCNSLASDYESNENLNFFEGKIIELLISYENAICSYRTAFSDKVYEKMNKSLTKEWDEHKKNYKIFNSIL